MRRIGLAIVLAVSLVLAPLAAEGQQSGKVYRIGVLGVNQTAHLVRRCDKVGENTATWRERTFLWSGDFRRAGPVRRLRCRVRPPQG